MRPTIRRALLSLSTLILAVLAWGNARAEYTTDSPVLRGLQLVLGDPDKKAVMVPDKSALVFVSKIGEVSFGADCQMRLHSAGTLERMAKLSEGFKVSLGEALGHRERKDPEAVGCLVKMIKDDSLNYRLRPNGMGFGGQIYGAKERPLDMWCSSMKLTVAPTGACTIEKLARGPLGFGLSKAPKEPERTSGTGGVTDVVSPQRTLMLPSGTPGFPACRTPVGMARGQITAQSRLNITSQSSFKMTWGGK